MGTICPFQTIKILRMDKLFNRQGWLRSMVETMPFHKVTSCVTHPAIFYYKYFDVEVLELKSFYTLSRRAVWNLNVQIALSFVNISFLACAVGWRILLRNSGRKGSSTSALEERALGLVSFIRSSIISWWWVDRVLSIAGASVFLLDVEWHNCCR